MGLYESSLELAELLENTKIAYLRTDPEVIDFTAHQPGNIIINGGKKRVVIELNRQNADQVLAVLQESVFNKECISTLFTWNIKSLISYFRFYIHQEFFPANQVLDLHTIEHFLGIAKNAPENIVEAVNRSKVIVNDKSWNTLYKSLHLPLIFNVLPSIETTPLLDETDRVSKYVHYVIEGQVNGRLKCMQRYKNSYIAHSIGPDLRSSLKPKGYDNIFLCFDMKYCEVVVLQWLSQDEKLKEIMTSGVDLHQEIYRMVTGDVCDTVEKREISKRLFLPVVYGCGAKRLSENLGLPLETAREIIDRINRLFPTAMAWIMDKQTKAKTQTVKDYFGRPRNFIESECYLARNFVVQSVAATVCLEKLVDVYRAITKKNCRICFTIHDGYGLVCAKTDVPSVIRIVKPILESESKLCPGRELKASVKYGKMLDQLKELKPQ